MPFLGLGRNALRGNGLSQIDLAVDRTLIRRERLSLESRVQVFNVLNQVNYADPVRHLDSPYFGQPASLANRMLGSGNAHSGLAPAFQIGGPRTLECSLRVRF
jgi:hypothetical protein